MKLTFIGTGSGKTSLNRYHSSLLLSSKKDSLLIDAGDGISRALLKANIDYNLITGILFSHLHPDHYSGFASLIVQMKMNNRIDELKVYTHQSLIEVLRNFLLNSYLLPERMGFEINFIPFSEKDSITINEEIIFEAFRNSHLENIANSTNKISLSFISCSFLFTSSNQKIFYTGDIGSANDILINCPADADLIITEVTHIQLNQLPHILQKFSSSKFYFTHITDEEEKLESLIANLPQKLTSKPIIAFDGLRIEA